MIILIKMLIQVAVAAICFIIGIGIGINYEKNKAPEDFKFESPTDRCEHCKKCKRIVRYNLAYGHIPDSVYCGFRYLPTIPQKCSRFKPKRKKMY